LSLRPGQSHSGLGISYGWFTQNLSLGATCFFEEASHRVECARSESSALCRVHLIPENRHPRCRLCGMTAATGHSAPLSCSALVPAGTGFDYICISGTPGLGTCTRPAYMGSGAVMCHKNSSMAPNTTWTVRLTVFVTAPPGTTISECSHYV